MHPRDAFPVHLVGGPAELVTGFTWWVWEREGQLARRPDTPPDRLWLTHLYRTPEKWRLHAEKPRNLAAFGREIAALYWLERERDDSPRQQSEPEGYDRYVYAYVPPEEHSHYLADPE